MDIKVTINTTTPLVYENEDILSLYTSFRSTSKPNEPTYGAFTSDGSITIRDNSLDLYKKAQEGVFDKYNYEVVIALKNDETGLYENISTQIINRRPTYNYADKTLTIQLADKIDSMDNLVYEGYPYNLEAETAYDIILDLLTKFWDGTKALACLSANAYGTTTFASIFQDITIQYPYIAPQTTYRAAFSSVLSLAHCALICNENGNPRLIYLDKTTQEVEDTEVAVLTADKTQEAFTTSVILDNKFDNAQVQATNVSQKYDVNYSLNVADYDETQSTSIYNNATNSAINFNVLSVYRTDRDSQVADVTNNSGVHSSIVVGRENDTENNYKMGLFSINVPQYTNNNWDTLLSVKELSPDNVSVVIKQTITKKTARADENGGNVWWSYGTINYNQYQITLPNETAFAYDEQTFINYVSVDNSDTYQDSLNDENVYWNKQTTRYIGECKYYGFWQETNISGTEGKRPYVSFTYNFDNVKLQYNRTTNNYTASFSYPIGRNIVYYATQATFTDLAHGQERVYPAFYRYEIIEEPVSIQITINGVVRTINLENIKAVGEGTKDNVAEVNTYGKLLQYGLNISNPNVADEIEHITDYYENGLHTANITVLGGVGYNSLGVETITETITEVTFENVYYGNFTVIPSFTAQILLQIGQGNPNYTSTRTTALKDIIMSSNEHINFVYSTSSITYRGTVIDNNTQNKFIRFYGAYQYTAEQGSSTVSGNYSYIISFNFNSNRVTEDLTVSFTNVATSGYYYNLISYISGQIRLQMSNDFNFSWVGIGDKKIETETIITHDVPVPYDNDKQVFACGEYVTVKNYDNESPLYYRETEVPLQWQITENKITFDGGAVTQALTLKELKKQT